MVKDPFIPPPPKQDEVFNNVEMQQVRFTDGRRNRTKKPEEQFNTKARPGVKDEIDQRRRMLSAELGRDVTRGEFLEWMIAAYDEKKDGAGFAEALQQSQNNVPSANDEAYNRTKPLKFFASDDVEQALNQRVNVTGWTLGGVIEDLMVKALRLVEIEQK